jgi:hypothetical protein
VDGILENSLKEITTSLENIYNRLENISHEMRNASTIWIQEEDDKHVVLDSWIENIEKCLKELR